MAFRRIVALALLGGLVSLPALAYASPPDQSWLGGWYDDADYDDVVDLVTSTSGTATSASLVDSQPHWIPITTVPLADGRLVGGPELPPHQPRGPPPA